MTQDRYQEIKAGSFRERFQFVLKDSAFYGTAAALNKMLTLLTLPVLTRVLSTAEYGALDAMTGLGAIFVAFIVMGLDSAIARLFFEHEGTEDRKELVSQALSIELAFCVVITAICWFSADWMLSTFYGIEGYATYLKVLIVSLPFVVLTRFASNLLKWTFARNQYMVVAFGSSALVILLTLLFVVGFDQGIQGVYRAQVIGFGISAAVGIFLCRKHLIVPKSTRYAREMMGYGAPFMVVAVAGCVMPAIDRVFITNYMGLDSAGLYAIGYRYGFMLMLPITAFMTSWSPFAFSIYKEDNAEETYNHGLKFMVAGLCAITIAMVATAEPIITLVASERYLPVYVVVLPLLLRLVIQATSSLASLGIRLAKRTQFQMLGYLIGLVSSALFVWLLIEPLGLIGVACGALLGQLAQSISEIAFAYYVYPLRFQLKRPIAMLLVTGIGGVTMQAITLPSLPQQVALRAGVVLVVGALLWVVTFGFSATARLPQFRQR